MKDVILSILEAGITAKRSCVEANLDNIIKTADMLTACMTAGGKVLFLETVAALPIASTWQPNSSTAFRSSGLPWQPLP